jgi:hypothetical protein
MQPTFRPPPVWISIFWHPSTDAIASGCNARLASILATSTGRGGRQQEAVALLAPVLGWFEEGVDTADLQAARTLLDELTEPAIAAEG